MAFVQQDEVSYEDICRAHIEEFIAAAAAAETQTALGARVSDWRSKIGPVLEEQVCLSPSAWAGGVGGCAC